MKMAEIRADCYRIPFARVLSSSRHGRIPDFELITARVRDDEGAEGTGYTYTIGQGGVAMRAMVAADLAPVLVGEDPRPVERLWERMWWRLHWVGRGGAASFAMAAVDVALWDLKAKRLGEPLWRLRGGHSPEVEVYFGGIDLEFPLDQLIEQTRDYLAAGENLHTAYEFRSMIASGAVAFPQPDVATLGGITPWLKVAALAELHNLPISTHGVHDLQVHLLAAIPNASYLEVHGFGLEKFMRSSLSFKDGKTAAPDRPGHGVGFLWEALEEFRE